jgi:large subunit ribosomal protein L6
MSRIGKLPIKVPAGVNVTIAPDGWVTVKGPKGTLAEQVKGGIKIQEEDGFLVLTRPSEAKPHKALHGLYRALVNNLVIGVTDGFSKTLEMVGTGYRAQAQGDTLTINIGFSHPVVIKAPANISFETPAPTKIVVKGINKQQVGNMAADIRKIRKPEPYLGKGIKYENEQIRRKEGKTGK